MYYEKGRFAKQAHVGLPEGTVEEEYGRNGFFGAVSHLYRPQPPVAWTDIDGELKPEAFNTNDLDHLGTGDFLTGRIHMLYNNDISIAMSILEPNAGMMDFCYRNADGDEILFVHAGTGRLSTDFGDVIYEKGDYLVIPRGCVYQVIPSEKTALLVIESVGEVKQPERGMLGHNALYDQGVIKVPCPTARLAADPSQTEWKLKIKRRNNITTVTYPFNPMNAIGWKGTLTVWQLNIRDIRPVSSERYHLPPSVHTTFVLRNAVVCSFLPRPLETGDPVALRVPFFHSNIDFDEVLFYHDGNFFSRKGIDSGMITFHPQGIHHGPQPGAEKTAETKTHTDEKAVMIDTRYPLEMTAAAKKICRTDYWKSWMGYLH